MYRIGQLSKETNITIRTLRHYDKLGLLKPSMVTEAGYRYYSKADVMKLQRITALKQLGFPLVRIKEVLAEEEDGAQEERWKAGIRLQLEAIEEEKQRLQMMEQILYAALHALEMAGDVSVEEILLFIKAVQSGPERRLAFFQQHFTRDEIAILNQLPELTTDDPRTREWVQLWQYTELCVVRPLTGECVA
jgi:DNA-binding transcriptional MerR regulator